MSIPPTPPAEEGATRHDVLFHIEGDQIDGHPVLRQMTVILTPGYTTFASIPAIVAMVHGVTPEQITVHDHQHIGLLNDE